MTDLHHLISIVNASISRLSQIRLIVLISSYKGLPWNLASNEETIRAAEPVVGWSYLSPLELALKIQELDSTAHSLNKLNTVKTESVKQQK